MCLEHFLWKTHSYFLQVRKLCVINIAYLPIHTKLAKPESFRDYTLLEFLGRGGCGEVYKCAKHGKEYALKCFENDKNDQLEYTLSRFKLVSKFLVRNFEFFRDSRKRLCVVMELCPRTTLKSVIAGGSMDSLMRVRIFIQLLLGVEALHRSKILRHSVTPSGVFVDLKGNVKIGDYVASEIQDITWTTWMGVDDRVNFISYQAPEVLRGEIPDASANMWSVSVVMYELCARKRPFENKSIYRLMKLIAHGVYEPLPATCCPTEISDIICSLLKVNPKHRPSALSVLRHQTIQAYAQKLDLLNYFLITKAEK